MRILHLLNDEEMQKTQRDHDFYYEYIAPLIIDSDLDVRLDALSSIKRQHLII